MTTTATPPAASGRTHPRISRVTAVLVALACVVVAGIAVKITEHLGDDIVCTVDVGQSARLNGGIVTVTRVRPGTVVDDGSDRINTLGMFLAVTVRVAAPGAEQTVGEVGGLRLYTADRTYRAFGNNQVIKVPAGYVVDADMLFEVDPGHIAGATLEIFASEIIYARPQKIRVRLGIEPSNAAHWAAAARGQLISTDGTPDPRALP